MSRRQRSRRNSRASSRWGRVVGWGLGLGFLLAAVGVLGGYLWLTSYLRSEKFLAMVNERASTALGAEVEVSRFFWDGMLVTSPLIEVRGEDLVRNIEIEGMETEVELASLLRRQVRSTPVHLDRVSLSLDVTKPPPVMKLGSTQLEFPGLVIDECMGRVSFGGPALNWSNARVEVASPMRGVYEIEARNGTVTTPITLFPSGDLRGLRARVNDGRLYLTEGEFGVYESGRLTLRGDVGLRGGAYNFEGQLRDIYGREMVPEDWKKRIEGVTSSDFTVTGAGGRPPVVEGHLSMREGVLTGLPVFDRIAAYADTTRFRRLVLSKAHLNYKKEGEVLELRDIVLVSEGLMRVEGRLDVVGRNLDGAFRLGLTPGTLARIPGAETRVFLPGEEGLLWSTVHITGTLEDPKEDLSRRLIAAAGLRMFETIPETGEQVLRHTQRKASEMALKVMEGADAAAALKDAAVDQGGGVLEGGVGLVTEGINAAFGLLPARSRPPVDPDAGPEEEEDSRDSDPPTSSP